jgi:hypothetical protein|tara:strand:+ start:7554 stop:8123 length:570 start_codon:yes stop_codon:yes gene_type:complete
MEDDKKLNERQKKFVERTRKKRDDKAIEITNNLLGTLIKQKLPFSDIHYMISRVKGILEAKIGRVDFKNEMIDRYRRDFLKSRLEECKKNKVKLTGKRDEREKRCEKICQEIAENVLAEDVAMCDQKYFDDAIENEDEYLLISTVYGYVDAVYDKLCMIAGENKRRADKKLWKKPAEEITWDDLNNILS